ncbi:MAG: proline--tRNA ligase, partial [Oscillospiraceae bacterium]|nr:proline--tRNA ligase [Oscillospiraceae bacterium]
FAEYEMKGVPVRVELGPRDIEAGQCVLVSRATGEKKTVALENITEEIKAALDEVHSTLYAKALKNREDNTFVAKTFDEMKEIAATKGGFVKTMWCGDLDCELKVKEEAGMTSRCMPFDQENISDVCPICGKPAKKMIYWGVAY